MLTSDDFKAKTDPGIQRAIAERLGWVNLSPRAYLYGRYSGSKEPGQTAELVPYWPASTDLALTLPIPPEGQWSLIYQLHGQDISQATLLMDMRVGAAGEMFQSQAPKDRLARAICEAWLLMVEQHPEVLRNAG